MGQSPMPGTPHRCGQGPVNGHNVTRSGPTVRRVRGPGAPHQGVCSTRESPNRGDQPRNAQARATMSGEAPRDQERR